MYYNNNVQIDVLPPIKEEKLNRIDRTSLKTINNKN